MATIFDPREIKAAGDTLFIRPIEWSGDPRDEGTLPTKYETTCPTCSQRVEIYETDIVDENVICAECPAEGLDCPFNLREDLDELVEEIEINDLSDEEVEVNEELLEVLDDNSTPSISVVHESGTQDNKNLKQQATVKPGRRDNKGCPFQDPVDAGELKPA